MTPLDEFQKLVLQEFYNLQCCDDDGAFDEERGGMTYQRLEKELGMLRVQLKPIIIALRNMKLIKLSPTVDYEEYRPNGSSYFLTGEGSALVKELFFISPLT